MRLSIGEACGLIAASRLLRLPDAPSVERGTLGTGVPFHLCGRMAPTKPTRALSAIQASPGILQFTNANAISAPSQWTSHRHPPNKTMPSKLPASICAVVPIRREPLTPAPARKLIAEPKQRLTKAQKETAPKISPASNWPRTRAHNKPNATNSVSVQCWRYKISVTPFCLEPKSRRYLLQRSHARSRPVFGSRCGGLVRYCWTRHEFRLLDAHGIPCPASQVTSEPRAITVSSNHADSRRALTWLRRYRNSALFASSASCHLGAHRHQRSPGRRPGAEFW